MQKKVIIIVILFVGVFLASCNRRTSPQAVSDKGSTTDQKMWQHPEMAVNYLAFDLLRQMSINDDNLIFSPFSISTAMGMTYLGAREETRDEMSQRLYFNPDLDSFQKEFKEYIRRIRSLDTDSISLNVANSLWAQIDYHFLDTYFAQTRDAFDARVKQTDFVRNREESRKKINQWVLDETRNMIRDLISPDALTSDTRLVLVNAIYFHGLWAHAFDPEQTFQDIFFTRNNLEVQASYMFREGTFQYLRTDSMQILKLPYAGNELSMTIVLPSEEFTVRDIENKLGAQQLQDLSAQMEELKTMVFVPKFEAETKINLEETFMQMGLTLPFDNRADFSGMTGIKDLKIDKIIHQAKVEVDEEGTEAAAATAVIVIRKTALDPEEPIIFRANRPFLFFIGENDGGSILFAGRIMNPS